MMNIDLIEGYKSNLISYRTELLSGKIPRKLYFRWYLCLCLCGCCATTTTDRHHLFDHRPV